MNLINWATHTVEILVNEIIKELYQFAALGKHRCRIDSLCIHCMEKSYDITGSK
jgi:hypothetical protein